MVLARAGLKLPASTITQSLPQTPTADLLGERAIGMAAAAAIGVETSLGAAPKIQAETDGENETGTGSHYLKAKQQDLKRQESRRLGQQLITSTIAIGSGGESPSARRYSEGDLQTILRCEAPLCRPEEESDSLMNDSHEGPESGHKPHPDAADGEAFSTSDPRGVQMRETAVGGASGGGPRHVHAAGLAASSLIGGSDRYVGASGSAQSRSRRALERYRRFRRTVLNNMPALFGGARRPASQPVSSSSAGASQGAGGGAQPSKPRGGAIARLCSAAFAVEVAPVNKDAASLVASSKRS